MYASPSARNSAFLISYLLVHSTAFVSNPLQRQIFVRENSRKRREKKRESTSARLVTIWIISCLDYCNSIFRTFYVWILSYYSCFDAGCRVLEDYMNDRVKYVITNSRWDDNFEEVSAVLMSQPSYCQCWC